MIPSQHVRNRVRAQIQEIQKAEAEVEHLRRHVFDLGNLADELEEMEKKSAERKAAEEEADRKKAAADPAWKAAVKFGGILRGEFSASEPERLTPEEERNWYLKATQILNKHHIPGRDYDSLRRAVAEALEAAYNQRGRKEADRGKVLAGLRAIANSLPGTAMGETHELDYLTVIAERLPGVLHDRVFKTIPGAPGPADPAPDTRPDTRSVWEQVCKPSRNWGAEADRILRRHMQSAGNIYAGLAREIAGALRAEHALTRMEPIFTVDDRDRLWATYRCGERHCLNPETNLWNQDPSWHTPASLARIDLAPPPPTPGNSRHPAPESAADSAGMARP